MFRPLVKNVLMAGLLTIAVWTLFIFYWRANLHMPSSSDVFVSLILMPIALILSVFVARKVAVALIGSKEPASQTGRASTGAETGQDGNPSQQEREWILPIIAGNVITMHGQTVGDLADAIAAKEIKFGLDPHLADVNGYPILSGRIADLDEAEPFDQFERWQSEQGKLEQVWQHEDKRSIALAYTVLIGLTEDLLARREVSQLETNGEGNGQNWPVIHLLNLWPAHWTESQKQSVTRWFGYLLSEHGWPAEKVLINSLNVMSVPDAMVLIDRLNVQVHRQKIPGLHFIVASQSFLGEKTIEDWQVTGQLQTSQHKNGRIPGEGAAGMIISDGAPWGTFIKSPVAQLHRVSQRRRDKSADDAGKIKPDILVETIKDALTVAKVAADGITKISADTDGRARRTGELMEALNEVMPDLDLDAGCFRLEADCGHLGVASALTALVLGWHQSVEQEQPVLCISNNDSFERTALVINVDSASGKETTV